jgi:hypothetical protein
MELQGEMFNTRLLSIPIHAGNGKYLCPPVGLLSLAYDSPISGCSQPVGKL